jgi:hypothetical protein
VGGPQRNFMVNAQGLAEKNHSAQAAPLVRVFLAA